MVQVRYGGNNGAPYELEISTNHLVVRTQSRQAVMPERAFEVSPLSAETRRVLDQFQTITRFREAGVELLSTKNTQADGGLRDNARRLLKAEPEVAFAGRVLVDAFAKPLVYTENLFVKFEDDEDDEACQGLLQQHGLSVKRALDYARQAFFVAAPPNCGLTVFEIAATLLADERVELCHPELVGLSRERRQAFPPQWHLKATTLNGRLVDAHADVEAAWQLSDGSGAIVAVVDDGIDIDHEEFRSSGKIIAPRDVTRQSSDPRPGRGDDHGTACAGVSCANGQFGAAGVAPGARLIPIRLASGLGSQAEAEAFVWAARNGADVISCSWGPADGAWWDPNDPAHRQVVPLPDSTRLAMDFATNQGRSGKGCVIVFAAGNGNESVDNDGYASYSKVIAVAACNDQSKRSAYSDFGRAVWCSFPSNDGRPSLTPGIWTTDRSGVAGYNQGSLQKGDGAGHYTNSFGGTSSACPGVAGVAALIIARNPALRWDQVREILRQSCVRIDPAGGNYDASGRSPFYGYGRVSARKAVELALPAQPLPAIIFKVVQDVPINDFQTSRLTLPVAGQGALKSIKVAVDLDHTYSGDLVLTLIPPPAMGAAPLLLHDRTGGSTDNIKTTYDEVNKPALSNLKGKDPSGTWTLEVADKAGQDTGTLRSLRLEMTF
ncbi:S8 family serine peptidase [Synechococcus sp. Tobar12-5m-g]|uniref:S8 family serine peptidase n=1 Tax=unclassified Synechococcus TaxID=2626047 RepID=UPI0020CC1F54|nr:MULTISPECIES: S8 family serine peptidase [unclassified Synechococcus]MCP9773414.1 S8 family serine peptidase [Synechococcus sp. Tobar12-5m-g]MCP9874218.1 S8 family serine peptidase [Synechococcus sp. Cruz CV-v-12]